MFITSNKSTTIKLIIKFTSADKRALNKYINKIKTLFNKKFFKFKYTFLPSKKKHFYILRSPHVYKKSIETYEECIYTAQFKFIFTTSSVYLRFLSIYKFLIKNIPLNIKITVNLSNNVKTNLL